MKAPVKVGFCGGTGLAFVPGHWRADAPSGTPIPEPEKPERIEGPETADRSGRRRDPRTAANIAAHEAALSPRRWTPSAGGHS